MSGIIIFRFELTNQIAKPRFTKYRNKHRRGEPTKPTDKTGKQTKCTCKQQHQQTESTLTRRPRTRKPCAQEKAESLPRAPGVVPSLRHNAGALGA